MWKITKWPPFPLPEIVSKWPNRCNNGAHGGHTRKEEKMGCTDCGIILTEENINVSNRLDVCKSCWDTRLKLIIGEIVPINSYEFKEIQRKMRSRRGTAKKFIESLSK